MSNEELIYTQKGSTAWLTLNRPKAMTSTSLSIIARMEELLPQIAADDSVRVVVLTGSGPAFCAGADLKQVLASRDLPPGEPDMLDRVCYNVMNPLRDFPKPRSGQYSCKKFHFVQNLTRVTPYSRVNLLPVRLDVSIV